MPKQAPRKSLPAAARAAMEKEIGEKKIKACVAIDEAGNLYSFFDPPDVPALDLNSGDFAPAHSIRFRANPSDTCWEYVCTRYGCFWMPVPCA